MAITVPDALPRTARVAVVPCYNEGRNPIDLLASLLTVPELSVVFIDDGSDGPSRDVLNEISHPRVAVVRNANRIGKAASLVSAMRDLDPGVEKIALVDCDVSVRPGAIEAMFDELDLSDLVLANSRAIARPRTAWELGAIFSANRHDRLRENLVQRYPARCTNGRLLGISRRLADAIVRSDVPPHTEDAHFMLVCLSEGYAFSYRRDAMLEYRAPETLADYLRQSNRFSEGRALLRERWSEETLERYYDLRLKDVLATALAQAIREPAGAAVFLFMTAAKVLQRRRPPMRQAGWSVSTSTKVLR
jgi:cellulose synthase/poly-beta-1,6-N-acetylglucosamine synthase-like glycosyltransferase